MTQKEKLYEQLLIEMNKVHTYKGEQTINIDALKADWRFSCDAKHYTVRELKIKINQVSNKLEEVKKAKAIEDYFATPEGAEIKAKLEEERKEYISAYQVLNSEHLAKVKDILEQYLPTAWAVKCTDVGYIEICLIDPISKNEVFGHNFNLRLNEDWDSNGNTFHTLTTNIGTMGSFNPLKDIERVALYKVFADIITNETLMHDLQDIMINASKSKWQIREIIQNLDTQLQNQLA